MSQSKRYHIVQINTIVWDTQDEWLCLYSVNFCQQKKKIISVNLNNWCGYLSVACCCHLVGMKQH